jgi:Tfp pilus assembly protein PilO
MKKRESGGAGTLLLILVLAAAAVYLVVYFFYLDKKSDTESVQEVDVEGVKVERGIRSVDRANQVLQDTKNTLRNQEKAMQDRMKKNLNP